MIDCGRFVILSVALKGEHEGHGMEEETIENIMILDYYENNKMVKNPIMKYLCYSWINSLSFITNNV